MVDSDHCLILKSGYKYGYESLKSFTQLSNKATPSISRGESAITYRAYTISLYSLIGLDMRFVTRSTSPNLKRHYG